MQPVSNELLVGLEAAHDHTQHVIGFPRHQVAIHDLVNGLDRALEPLRGLRRVIVQPDLDEHRQR